MTRQLDLSLTYRRDRAAQDSALGEAQPFLLTGDGAATEWARTFMTGQSPEQKRRALAEARYLDWWKAKRSQRS